MNSKPVIGILGAIGSGKSAAAKAFAGLGCAVIDADKMALELLQEQDILGAITDAFGSDMLTAEGCIDRTKLAEKVFSDGAALEKLTGILHPPVLSQAQTQMDRYFADPGVTAVVLDVPLLMETGWHTRCDVLVFVDSPLEIRQQRVAQKGRFSPEQIKKRENFQISLDKKKQIAHYIVQNDSDLSDLAEQVARVYSAVMKVWG